MTIRHVGLSARVNNFANIGAQMYIDGDVV